MSKLNVENISPRVVNFIEKELVKFPEDIAEKIDAENDPYSEATLYNVTGDTSSIKPEYISKKIIPVVFAKALVSELFQLINMPSPTYAIPRLAYTKESSTAEVSENGQIKTAKVSTSNISMTATKFAIRSILTKEALEDASKVGFDVLGRVMEYDVKTIIDELDTKLVALLKVGAAAGDVWWDINIESEWSTNHPSREYSETLYDAILQGIKLVAANKFRADFMLMNPADMVRVTGLKFFVPSEPDNSLQGVMGNVHNLKVYTSLNADSSILYVGQKKIFGVFGSYIPLQYNAGGYDAEYDRQDWNVRTRSAMLITQGEAVARVILFDNYTNEDVPISDGTGYTAHAPINAAETLTAKDGDGSTSLTIITYDSRTESKPTSSDANTIILDLETGLVTVSSGYSPTNDKVIFAAYSARA